MGLFVFMALVPSPFLKVEPKIAAAPISTKTVSKAVQAPKTETPPVTPVEPEKPVVDVPAPVQEAPKPEPIVAPVAPPPPTYPTDHIEIMQQAGISPADYSAVEYVVSHESGWRYWIANNEGSGATGLCQALPASKMASAGADYLTNPVTQMKWCDGYAKSRYGSWAIAMATGIARDTTGSGWGWW